MRLELSPDEVAMLLSRTEGWIAGLQFAGLSLRGRSDISPFLRAFSGSHRFVLEYLSEEVFAQQSMAVQSFLLQTCLLEQMTGSLCDALTGEGNGQAMLDALERANMFVISLDDERQWYRYHQLFADMLRSRLHQARPSLVPALHLRASTWYEQHGLVIEAVRHALAAPDFEQAAHLIEQYGLAIGGQGQYSTILGWLDALPEPLVRGNARLSLLYATALRTTDQLEAIEARLQDAERCVEAGMPTEEARVVVGWVTVVRASLALYTGDHAGCVSLARDAEAKARMGSSLEILLLRALAWQAEGSDNNALADLERALVLAEPEGYIRLFLDEGPAMLDLLRVAGSRGLAPDYIATLMTTSGEEPAATRRREAFLSQRKQSRVSFTFQQRRML